MNKDCLALCRQSEKIYIYGAGKNATYLYHYLVGNAVSVDGFIVSSRSNNPLTLLDRPVELAESHKTDKGELILVSVLPQRPGYTEILDIIVRRRWRNVFFFSDKLFVPVRNWNTQPKPKISFRHGAYYIDADAPVEQNHSILAMEKDGKQYHWRMENKSLEYLFADISQVFSKKTALEEFTEQYGTYLILDKPKDMETLPDVSACVYMTRCYVDHPARLPILPDWICPIQVGAAFTDECLCDVRDNEGDNISDRNHLYSEGTALYWMWKHAPKHDYIGLYHYRRHIDLPGQDLRLLAANQIDVLVTAPTFAPEGLAKVFLHYIPKADMEILVRKIREMTPEYYPYAEEFFHSRFYPPCNISIMRDEIFREYARYLFTVAFAVEDYYRARALIRNDRYMGFLIECLLGIFLMKHRDDYRIAYADMLFYSPEV